MQVEAEKIKANTHIKSIEVQQREADSVRDAQLKKYETDVDAQVKILLKQAEQAGPAAELRAKVDADPNDHQARFDLAQALYANGEAETAVDELLDLFRRDREWNDGAAKTQLFTIFEALKPNDPVVLNGRRKLSSMIFA